VKLNIYKYSIIPFKVDIIYKGELILTPKNQIQAFVRQAKSLQSQAKGAISSSNSPILPVVGEFALKEYVPYGYKGTARKVGTKIARGNKDAINRQWRERGTELLRQCTSEVRKMSINTKNLTFSGNSQQLIRKFNRLKKIKNALPFFNNLIAILEEIEDMDLIWNNDISDEMKNRQQLKEEEKQQKAQLRKEAKEIVKNAQQIELYERTEIIRKVSNYPRARQSLSAAFDRLQDTNPESARHCITSCRVGIEQFCIDAGGSNDWKTGLRNIYKSETDRKHIKAVWNYLSGKGMHGGHDPNKTEAEHCLKITIASIEAMLNKINN
jgi:NADH:ubiquinone oxidoreductase subunit E